MYTYTPLWSLPKAVWSINCQIVLFPVPCQAGQSQSGRYPLHISNPSNLSCMCLTYHRLETVLILYNFSEEPGDADTKSLEAGAAGCCQLKFLLLGSAPLTIAAARCKRSRGLNADGILDILGQQSQASAAVLTHWWHGEVNGAVDGEKDILVAPLFIHQWSISYTGASSWPW